MCNFKSNIMSEKFYAFSVAALSAMALISCSKDADLASDGTQLGNNTLTIRAKAATTGTTEMTVATPINVYVFNSGNKCLAVKKLSSETESAEMKLEAGNYNLYAVAGAGDTDYVLPGKDIVTPQSVVSLNGGSQHSDLMAAKSSVTLVDGQDCDVSLPMERKVLKLTYVSVADVPDDVTSITVTVSPLYQNITVSGDYSGEQGAQNITLARESDGTTWRNDCNLFLLPSAGNAVVTLKFTTTDGQTKTFTYESEKPLKANYKVSLSVNYLKVKEPTLNCKFIGVSWEEMEDAWTIDADERDFTTTDGQKEETGSVVVGSVYKGCYVLKTEKSGGNTVATLIAPKGKKALTFTEGDQSSIKSAVDAAISELSVDGIGGWRLPSVEELKYVKENLSDIQTKLTDNSLETIVKSTACYYLSDGGEIKCFYLANGLEDSPKSEKSSMYLRPFATIVVSE